MTELANWDAKERSLSPGFRNWRPGQSRLRRDRHALGDRRAGGQGEGCAAPGPVPRAALAFGGRADILSLVETAKLNGLGPRALLRDVLNRFADHPHRRPATLEHCSDRLSRARRTLARQLPARSPVIARQWASSIARTRNTQ
jgi:hypothetical protein